MSPKRLTRRVSRPRGVALSGVARADRISPWMSTGERRALAGRAPMSTPFATIAVSSRARLAPWPAHGADLLMQLGLNEEIGEGEAIVMARAIFEALMVDEAPALVFEEPARWPPLIF